MMHKRTILIAGLVLIALVAAGAAFAMSTDEPSEATVYTADDDGTSIVLEPGESFSVVLPGNATTGYSWQVEGIGAAILSASEPVYVSDSELVGAGGVYTFTFTAAAAGETELRLVYHRPWEQVEPLQTFTMAVTIPDLAIE
jgi:inhibitor of cysteine peptidase